MRLFRHLFAPSAHALFPPAAMDRITATIDAAELRHAGEICFAVEPALHWLDVLRGVDPRRRAEDAFARLRVWDTASNTGVLLYLLLADHRIEIVADRGLRAVTPVEWRAVCEAIEARLRAGEAEAGIVAGIGAISALLERHAPQAPGARDEDELPNRPRLL